MKKRSMLATAVFTFSLFVAPTMAQALEETAQGARFEHLRTPVQQSPEAQTPGVIEQVADRSSRVGTPQEFYGMAPKHVENNELRTLVQQSPEMQTPGVVELYPAGPESH